MKKLLLTTFASSLAAISMAQSITFQEQTSISSTFIGVGYGATAYGDIDNDGDIDLLLFGEKTDGSHATRLYKNNGSGQFSIVPNIPFEDMADGDAVFADIDSDGDLDLIISGQGVVNNYITDIYLNDGTGNFTLDTNNTDLVAMNDSKIAVADIDKDGDLDLVITGEADVRPRIRTVVYKNDGSGLFVLQATDIHAGANGVCIKFADVNNDTYPDILVTGDSLAYGVPSAKLYINDTNGDFILKSDSGLEGVVYSNFAFGDINSDGNVDVVISGRKDGNIYDVSIYTNDGTGVFTKAQSYPGLPVSSGSTRLADLDNDGDLDLVVSGLDYSISSQSIMSTFIFSNDGSGQFTELTNHGVEGVMNDMIELVDLNNDNLIDIVVSGRMTNSDHITKIYFNTTFLPNGLQEALANNASKVYPNPSNHVINIAFDNAEAAVTVTIFDMVGRQVYTESAHNVKEMAINNTWPVGSYNMVITTNSCIEKHTFIVK